MASNCYMFYNLFIECRELLSETKRKEDLETVLMMKKSRGLQILDSRQKYILTAYVDPELQV